MGVMAEIRSALQAGASREQLVASGFKRSSVYQGAKQLKVGAGDGRRRRVQPASSLPIRVGSPALPAPSSELSDMRDQVQLVKLGNDLAVAKQQAIRLKPEIPEPPSEIDNARAMIGLISDAKTLFPPPELSPLTPPAGDSKLNSGQLLNLDIARMEMEERQLIRGEARELQQVEQKAELIQEIGGHITRGLSGFLKVLQETKLVAPARVRAPALNPKAPASFRQWFSHLLESGQGQVPIPTRCHPRMSFSKSLWIGQAEPGLLPPMLKPGRLSPGRGPRMLRVKAFVSGWQG